MHSDPIADLLARIKNGLNARKEFVDAPASKIKVEIVKLLEKEGFVAGHELITEGKFPAIRIHLRYDAERKPIIHSLRRVSTPGLRVYKGADELRPIRAGLATRIVTTSQGLLTDREARRRRVGGEILCEVW